MPQGGWPHNWESAPPFSLFPRWFLIVQLQLCSLLLALLGRLRVHIKKMFLQLSGHFWLHLDLVLGSSLLGATVGALWIRNLVLSTVAVSDVAWLGWGVGICGVHISHSLSLRCPVVLICNTISVLLRSICPLSSIGLTNIYIGVLIWGGPRPFYLYNWYQNHLPRWWNLCPCIGVYRVLMRFFMVHIRRVLVVPWGIHALQYLLTSGHTLPFRLWRICSHLFASC